MKKTDALKDIKDESVMISPKIHKKCYHAGIYFLPYNSNWLGYNCTCLKITSI